MAELIGDVLSETPPPKAVTASRRMLLCSLEISCNFRSTTGVALRLANLLRVAKFMLFKTMGISQPKLLRYSSQ